jgi:AraC family ethanolamine operon transcriptional activator
MVAKFSEVFSLPFFSLRQLLCKELKISPRNAYLTFNKFYGFTPKQFLMSIRLTRAKKAFESSDFSFKSIQQIALENGFYHMSHFSKIYRDFFGELPSETVYKHKV